MLRPFLRMGRAAVLLTLLTGTAAGAQTFDKRTVFSFSGPVALPGVTLPAGEYLFRLADPSSSRSIVQVLSADGKTPYGLFFSLRADRFEAAGSPEVRFMETPKGVPAAIRTWWYPGERMGYEFIYPKEQARLLARTAGDPVLTTRAETTTTSQTNTSDLARVSASGSDTLVNAEAAPTTATPAGTVQQGTIASSTIVIPNVTLPAVAHGAVGDRATNGR